jgi:hypothetical protein
MSKVILVCSYVRTKAEFDTAINAMLTEIRPPAANYVQFQQRPGLLVPFQSLGMGILQIPLRVLMEHGSIFGTYHHFVCLLASGPQ